MQISAIWDHIPSPIKMGCIGLVCFAVSFLISMLRSAWRVNRNLKKLQDLIPFNISNDTTIVSSKSGLDDDSLDKIRTSCIGRQDASALCWNRIDEHIEEYSPSNNKSAYFLTEPLHDVLPFDSVVGDSYNGSFFGTVPGLLTGAGLTLTFVAILFALFGVHYDKSNTVNPITGIDTLINGLSGKFASSIIALFLSIVFTLSERACSRYLRNTYYKTLASISRTIPYLSPSRILLDIHNYSAKQAVSLSNLSSELVDRLTNTLNRDVIPGLAAGMSSGVANSLEAEFRPTMERMAASLDGLQTAIVHLESQKQDSVTGEFERMTQALETSITQALGKMGEQFHGALMGTAKDEFGQAQDSLESTRLLLEQMSIQFSGMQTSFSAIANKAEQVTSEQIQSGKDQTEALGAVMNGLMKQLQENADKNLSSMQSQLTRVMTDLTEKVSGLSEELIQSSTTISERTEKNVAQIIEQTDTWSKSSSARLETLLAQIEDRSQDFKEASIALLEAKTFMSNLLAQNATALSQMASASNDVKTYSTGLAGHTEGLKEIGKNHLAVSINLRDMAGKLRDESMRHEQLLQKYDISVSRSSQIFNTLDESIAKIMAATSTGLSDYNSKVEDNFNSIVEIADKLVPKAANLLSEQISEFGGRLEDLGDAINKSLERTRG